MMSVKSNRTKGHCPKCGADINANIVASFEHKWKDKSDPVDGIDTYRILQCCGCDRVYFQIISICSEDDRRDGPLVEHWPEPERKSAPNWVVLMANKDLTLHSLLVQTYVAFNTNLPSLAAVGLRAVFDRSAERLGVDGSLKFAEKLTTLVQIGKIGSDEREALEVLTDAGGAAIHRGWHPEQPQLDLLIEIMENFVYRNFFVIKSALELKAAVPGRATRVKAKK